jgi:hypothetical protein
MPSPEVLEFAEMLIALVRDQAVASGIAKVQPGAFSPDAKRWRKTGIQKQAGEVLVPDVVDEAIFYLLSSIDGGKLRLKFVAKN